MCKTQTLIRKLKLQTCATFTQASFTSYPWKEKKYDLIFLSHAIGYMDDSELIAFLREAASHLTVDSEKKFSENEPGNPLAAICILDNVSQSGENYKEESQWVRTADSLEKIYAQSGLVTAYKTQNITTHDDFVPVTVWLLEKTMGKNTEQKKEDNSEVDDDDSVDSTGMPMHLVQSKKERQLEHWIHNTDKQCD